MDQSGAEHVPPDLPDALKRFHPHLKAVGIRTVEMLHEILDPRLHSEEDDWLKDYMAFMRDEGCGLPTKADE